MQVLDEKKRLRILSAAAELFAAQPFHKVLLSDVAEAAGVGKGTLYIYFKNKDDLFLSVLYNGFDQLIDRIQEKVGRHECTPLENLALAVQEFVGFAYQNPHFFELMRDVTWRKATGSAHRRAKRDELRSLFESIIRQGIDSGDFFDPHPELTARFIPSLVRAVMLDGVQPVDRQALIDHILRFATSALVSGKRAAGDTAIERIDDFRADMD